MLLWLKLPANKEHPLYPLEGVVAEEGRWMWALLGKTILVYVFTTIVPVLGNFCVFVFIAFCILRLSTRPRLMSLFFSVPVFFSGFSIALDKNKPSFQHSVLQSHIGHCYGNSLTSPGNSGQLLHSCVAGCSLSARSTFRCFFCICPRELVLVAFWLTRCRFLSGVWQAKETVASEGL